MESLTSYFSGIGMDFTGMLKIAAFLLVGMLLISGILRFIFGKKTLIGNAVSSSIAIIFIYLPMALILSASTKLQWLVTPLPFVELTQDSIQLFTFQGSVYTVVASQLLSMIILAFLVNLADTWLPKKTNLFAWIFWRVVTVLLGLVMHFVVTWLFNKYLPMGIVIYAPVVLLAVLVVMLLTGALRLVVGAILTTVNPVIAAFYTFFFASVVGKQLTKAVLTTGIMVGIVYLLQHFGITALAVTAAALVAYIPFLLLLIAVWYIVSRFL